MVTGSALSAWLGVRSMWMDLCSWCECLPCVSRWMGEHSPALNVDWRVSGERSGMAEQCVWCLAHAWGVMQCEQSECVVSKEQ